MVTVFTLLLLPTLVLLVWGLVAPKSLATHSKRQPTRKHFGIGFGAVAIVLLILIGVTAPPQSTKPQTVQLTTAKSTQAAPKPSTTTTEKTVTQTKSVPFMTTTVQDSSLAQGTTQITTQGVSGVETLTYQDTYTDGAQTAQKLVSDVVTTKPVTQVTSVGTYVPPTLTPAPATTTPSPSSSCYPLTDGGNCYEPGEYCRTSDEGTTGIAGDGESITCEDNNGLRWEPN